MLAWLVSLLFHDGTPWPRWFPLFHEGAGLKVAG